MQFGKALLPDRPRSAACGGFCPLGVATAELLSLLSCPSGNLLELRLCAKHILFSLSLLKIEDSEDTSPNPFPCKGSGENGIRTPSGQAGHLPLGAKPLGPTLRVGSLDAVEITAQPNHYYDASLCKFAA